MEDLYDLKCELNENRSQKNLFDKPKCELWGLTESFQKCLRFNDSLLKK